MVPDWDMHRPYRGGYAQSSTGQLIGAAEPKAFQLLAYRRRARCYCSLSCLSFCSWWASSSSVASSSVAAWAWEAGDVPGLEAGSVAGAEVPTGEILACVVAGDLKAAPVALIVGARTEEGPGGPDGRGGGPGGPGMRA